MAQPSPPGRLVTLALAGSLLMFAGWIFAIVPSFEHLQNIALVVGIAIVGFGLVLIPSGLDFFWFPGRSGQKRGIGVLLVSVLPAAILFLLTVIILPIGAAIRLVALVAEFVGMAIYSRSWWVFTRERGR
ncbi:hypothetical protein [Nitrolancea hollandica]|uniref:Uncharacterized protein n=1 Tax=Nitrolancea hollandica Lb TaxID=1129897 RepID=I4END3_9BACT|nr:hypothetical protein [Nitrolancea hollandica]CCF86196.1 membrane hypothetical protein [Nitrolancea hollandica Lb]